MEPIRQPVIYEMKVGGAEESAENVKQVEDNVAALKDQLATLKEEPLEVAPEVKPPEEPEEKEAKKPLLPKKDLKP
jgi:hypothetical protein